MLYFALKNGLVTNEVSVHLYEKCCHFVIPNTLLCFRFRVRVKVRVRVSVVVSWNSFSVKRVFEQV